MMQCFSPMSRTFKQIKSRNKCFKAFLLRASKKICEERLACKGEKPFSVFCCNDCNSYQCEACEALLHDNDQLASHQRHLIPNPPEEQLCSGKCAERNFADVSCTTCDSNFCYLCDYNTHLQRKQNHKRTKFYLNSEEFVSCEGNLFSSSSTDNSTFFSSEISDDMLSVDCDESLPDLFPKHEIRPQYGYDNQSLKVPDTRKSFLLINDKELLQVKNADDFAECLGCEKKKLLKIVSIFGNTGDGKSYTLNHTFFNGEEVFQTSAAQGSCTVGVWVAYCPSLDLITIDTEGFLGQASNPNQRARMLLKILAISDIVIYRTRAERLHNDMFLFLGDASVAYSRHFSQELEDACSRCNIEGPLSVLGPAVIIFHETHHTNVLSDDGDKAAEMCLQARFQDLGLRLDAFSNLEYIGIRTGSHPTHFGPLRSKVEKHLKNSSVRMARSPDVIFKVLKVLNDKFCGNIDKMIPSTFPDQYFTCSTRCMSCKCRCSSSMNHAKDDLPHSSPTICVYQHQYENRTFLCKVCFERGEKVVVLPKTMESTDSSWMGLAKYAWSGYLLECSKCGVIYRNRQYWYGNKDPWDICVRTEICHVWPDEGSCSIKSLNTAQTVLDSLNSVSEVMTNLSAKPTKLLTSWVADQIAPSYWIPNSRITNCGQCGRVFEELEIKHHCRACGGGFCEACSSKSLPLPAWGSTPVRVCDKCFGNGTTGDTPNIPHRPEVTARKIGEAVHSTLGTVVSAVNFPLGFIKDSARPTYWVPDHLLTHCCVCKEKFSAKLSIHHCRACGEGVCGGCSIARRPVPSKGWNHLVRVCNSCDQEMDL